MSARSWVGRHKAWAGLLGLVCTLSVALVGSALYVDHELGAIPRLASGLGDGPDGEPRLSDPKTGEATDILIAGVDNGEGGPGVRDLARRGEWQPGVYRSDAIMLLHVTADWRDAYVVSFPRDSWVEIPGRGKDKINASFSYGGPSLLIDTLKGMGAADINHLVVVDWAGFRSLTDRLGGVEIQTASGTVRLEGEEALAYVRTRKTLPRGDFDRVRRQQNYLRAVSRQLVEGGRLAGPRRLLDTVGWASEEVLLDKGFTNGELRELAMNLRGFRPDDVTYLTAPVTGTGREGAKSVVRLDLELTRELLGALAADEVGPFLAAHPGLERLGASEEVP
jgi:LCP family protein required for cell wall assembly